MPQEIRTSRSPKLDINELASQLGVSTATLYRWRSTGADMPRGFKVGARVRWTQEAVDEWVKSQMRKEAS
jgi:excisionase family DNA binding protein